MSKKVCHVWEKGTTCLVCGLRRRHAIAYGREMILYFVNDKWTSKRPQCKAKLKKKHTRINNIKKIKL